MNKDQFLKKLDTHLKKLPQTERQDIIGDIEEFFVYAVKDGESEDAVCKRLGEPKKLAREYMAQSWIASANEKRSLKSMLKAFFYAAGLGAVNTLYAIFAVGVGYIIISVFYIVAVSIGLSGIAALAFGLTMAFVQGAALWLTIFAGIALICVGILLFIGNMSLAKVFHRSNIVFLNQISERIKEAREH